MGGHFGNVVMIIAGALLVSLNKYFAELVRQYNESVPWGVKGGGTWGTRIWAIVGGLILIVSGVMSW